MPDLPPYRLSNLVYRIGNLDDQEYFSDGLSVDLIARLSKVPEIKKVIARTSAFSFKGKNDDARAIGEKLGVSYLLEGSVQKSENKLRINVQLLKASDGSQLWSEVYPRDVDEIFKIQDEIVGAVMAKLKITMLGPLKTAITPGNIEVYNLLLQGKYISARLEPGFNIKAMEKFQQALAIDPNDARVWAAMSGIYFVNAIFNDTSYRKLVAKAKEAAEKAILLDDQVAEGHLALAKIKSAEWDWKASEVEFKKAMALSLEVYGISELYRTLGRLDESVAMARKVVERDPVNADAWLDGAISLYFSGKLDGALAASQKGLDISPHYLFGHFIKGNVYLLQGKFNEAIAEYKQDPYGVFIASGLVRAYFAAGRQSQILY